MVFRVDIRYHIRSPIVLTNRMAQGCLASNNQSDNPQIKSKCIYDMWTKAKVTKKGALKLVPLGHITIEKPHMLTLEAFSKKWLISPWNGRWFHV